MLGSPRVAKATRSPRSRAAAIPRAASPYTCRPPSRRIVMTSRSICTSGAASRTMDSARPTTSSASDGANTRSASRRARNASSVTCSGSPGPTPTPTNAGAIPSPWDASPVAAAGLLAPGSTLALAFPESPVAHRGVAPRSQWRAHAARATRSPMPPSPEQTYPPSPLRGAGPEQAAALGPRRDAGGHPVSHVGRERMVGGRLLDEHLGKAAARVHGVGFGGKRGVGARIERDELGPGLLEQLEVVWVGEAE